MGLTRLFIALCSAIQPYSDLQLMINLTRLGIYTVSGVSAESKWVHRIVVYDPTRKNRGKLHK